MSWLQVTVQTTDDQASLLELVLENLGALSVTFTDTNDDPVLEPELGTTPLWEGTTVVALFDAETAAEPIRDALLASGIASEHIQHEHLEDRDWEREWMTHFKPMRFGQRLWIVPSWTESPDPEGINLYLDPGLAFGTGTHPTTSLCLTWLERTIRGGESLVDFGCGSGVLAIAAALLGAKPVRGTDIDPQALEATQSNAARNNVHCETCLPESLPQEPADILIANILANPLLTLAPELAKRVLPGGKVALSGILREQSETVRQCYAQWFELDETEVLEDWVLISGIRHGGSAQ